MKQSNTFKRLGTGVVLTAFLVCCFFGATFTLRPAYAEWEDAPLLNLNDGRPVIVMGENEFLEPGMKIQRKFKIENKNNESKDVHYGFYFKEGEKGSSFDNNELVNVLKISILDETGTKTLVSGTIASMTKIDVERATVDGSYDILTAGEEKRLILQIYYPDNVGNVGMKESIENFDFCLVFSKNDVIENT